jgi:hypothetical protein
MLEDTEIRMRKGINENSEKQNSKNEETIEVKWVNIKKVVKTVVSEMLGFEERKKRNG